MLEARDEIPLINLQRQLSHFGLMIIDELGFEVFRSDSLTHHAHILEMNGDSYRLKRSR